MEKRTETSPVFLGERAKLPSPEAILHPIETQINLVTPNEAVVSRALAKLDSHWRDLRPKQQERILTRLLGYYQKRPLEPLMDFLHVQTLHSSKPWPILLGLFSSKNRLARRQAVSILDQLIQNKSLPRDRKIIADLPHDTDLVMDADNEPVFLNLFSYLFNDSKYPLLEAYESREGHVARWAAYLLDKQQQYPEKPLFQKIVGERYCPVLLPYLAFTRITFQELIIFKSNKTTRRLASVIKRSEKICGPKILRELISKLRWGRLNLGLQISPYYEVRIGQTFPYILSPLETELFRSLPMTKIEGQGFRVMAQGGDETEATGRKSGGEVVNRFRKYNLVHADLLSEILEVAPLTTQKVSGMIAKMDRIVADYVALFSAFSTECKILPEIYNDLRTRVMDGLDQDRETETVSVESTRLMQNFEDPPSLVKVRTIHGLKRYLHQQGLKLGFKLIDSSRTPNRSITLANVQAGQPVQICETIYFTDFEPGGTGLDIPYPVQVVVDQYQRQLLHGFSKFPHTRIFCYGNEVHYFLAYRNHPAFLRIDFAPPFYGGMIDLEYFGVSNYELDLHPHISLEFIRSFFNVLEFDFDLSGTHIHARYDKEKSPDLKNLCEKIEEIFCLAPYLMDIDWTIGSLQLDAEAKMKVAIAWSSFFSHWGVLPVNRIVSSDHSAIRLRAGASGPDSVENHWNGKGAYTDLFSVNPPDDFKEIMDKRLSDLEIPSFPDRIKSAPGQLALERFLLKKVNKMHDAGIFKFNESGLQKKTAQRTDAVACFAKMIGSKSEQIFESAHLALLIISMEKLLTFITIGRVQDAEVQKVVLPLRGDEIYIFALRDVNGQLRLAFYTNCETLVQGAQRKGQQRANFIHTDPAAFGVLARRNNYPLEYREYPITLIRTETHRFVQKLISTDMRRPALTVTGEKIINGLKAAPGRLTGAILFFSTDRPPIDYQQAIMVSAAIRPEDNAYLYQAGGVISTGGGILSHAGLTANQFKKPALIIPGRWEITKNTIKLFLSKTDYTEKHRMIAGLDTVIFSNFHVSEFELYEHDLAVLDVNQGTLSVIGSDIDSRIIYAELDMLAKTNRQMLGVQTDKEILHLRGRRLKSRFHVEKVLKRITSPVIAKFAVDEVLLGQPLFSYEGKADEQANLLGLLLDNDRVRDMVNRYVTALMEDRIGRLTELVKRAGDIIHQAKDLTGILYIRQEIIHERLILQNMYAALEKCVVAPCPENINLDVFHQIDPKVSRRLKRLYDELDQSVKQAKGQSRIIAHLLEQLNRISILLHFPDDKRKAIIHKIRQVETSENRKIQKSVRSYVLTAQSTNLAYHDSVGWKAANLAEVSAILEKQWVPPWFVVTDRAFEEIMEMHDPGIKNANDAKWKIRQSIGRILDRADYSDAQKSNRIFSLLENLTLPSEMVQSILQSYHDLFAVKDDLSRTDDNYVAVRSSCREEDAETAARAGEFMTFLYIRGERELIHHIQLTWGGLWTERAIHNRRVLGIPATEATGGGVIVQKIVNARVSGVLQTVNMGKGAMEEIVINAGLGLGEGIVSGTVAADQIIVQKERDLDPNSLRLNYIVADKTEQIVFDKKYGSGTTKSETLYHQRMRPALEYTEVVELVQIALKLEHIYGYPLDIEFALDESRLWILQVRPVPFFSGLVEEVIEKYPISVNKMQVKR